MATLHFLNVKQGDCSIIQHNSGRVTVIDVCNAKPLTQEDQIVERLDGILASMEKGANGDFRQREHPVNPISYLKTLNVNSVFRFILTHPDMDHMDGIKALFDEFSPVNFWDTNNNAEKEFGNGLNGGFDEGDWTFYKRLRDRNPQTDPKRLALFSGASGQFFNRNENGDSGADGLYVLAPTAALVANANACEDYNDCSYVLLYRTAGNQRILFAGDSHDGTWEHIVKNHADDVKNVDLLIAPHHGRDSDRSYDFLDVVNPTLTLFGNAESESLAYGPWASRGLERITNNQAGCVVVGIDQDLSVYVSCKAFAEKANPYTFESPLHAGYHYYGVVSRKVAASQRS